MANICTNKFYIYSSIAKNIPKIKENLENLFKEKLDGEIYYETDHCIEGYFDSKWCFPDEIFDNFFDEFSDTDLYMRCLSEEYGCDLVSMNIYVDGGWKEPQYFDLW